MTCVMKKLFLCSCLKIELRYPKSHSYLLSNLTFHVSISNPLTDSMVSLTSTPYAPMFWIGAAPTDHGMSARFSIPRRQRSAVNITRSCRLYHAPTVSVIDSSS